MYQASMYSMTAVRAERWFEKLCWWNISVFRWEKNDSATALSQHTPTAPIDWVMPFETHQSWNWVEVY